MSAHRFVARRDAAPFQALVEASEDAIVGLDLEGRVTSWNPAAERLYGWTAAEMLGRPLAVTIPSDRKAEFRDLLARYAGGEPVRGFVTRRLRKDGSLIDVSLSVVPIRDASGTFVGCVGFVRDIGAELRERAALAASEARFRALFDQAGDAVQLVDADWNFVDVNPRTCEMLGYTRAELLKMKLHEVDITLEDEWRNGVRLDAYLTPGVPVVVESVHRRKDGTTFPVEVSCSAVVADGVPCVLGIARDVTERRRAEDERVANSARAQELERLREVDRFKTQVVNTAAHELGTPLTPIKIQLHLLKRAGPKLAPEHRRAVDILDRNVDRLSHLVQDVLDVARLHAGRLSMHRATLDAAALLQEAAEAFQEPARHGGLRFDAEIDEGLVVHADAKRLLQVVYNLLANAIKFTPPDGAVALSARVEGASVVVRVRDSGIGVDPGDASRLFQPFSQVHGGERSYPGSGLGLFICRGIVEEHGGRIWIESAGRGRGATFAFTVPLVGRDP